LHDVLKLALQQLICICNAIDGTAVCHLFLFFVVMSWEEYVARMVT